MTVDEPKARVRDAAGSLANFTGLVNYLRVGGDVRDQQDGK